MTHYLPSFVSSSFKGNPEKVETSKHASKRLSQIESSHTANLDSDIHARLHQIWLVGAQNVRVAINTYVSNLQRLVTARDSHEMSQIVIDAGEILKRSIDDIINTQTGYATSLIDTLPQTQQNPAIRYWNGVVSQLKSYSTASTDACRDSTKHLAEITSKLWPVEKKMLDDVDKLYEHKIANVGYRM